jgi:hypothetical protein
MLLILELIIFKKITCKSNLKFCSDNLFSKQFKNFHRDEFIN